MRDCDLGQAILDGCIFYACDLGTLRLPSWPHFALVDPDKNRQSWKSLPLPPSFWVAKESLGIVPYADPHIAMLHVPTVDPQADLHAMRQLLEAQSFIRIFA
jgi:hypothetical protein